MRRPPAKSSRARDSAARLLHLGHRQPGRPYSGSVRKISRSSQGATRRMLVLPATLKGTPAVTTRGYREPDCVALAHWICDVLDNPTDENVIAGVRENVTKQCRQFPVYG